MNYGWEEVGDLKTKRKRQFVTTADDKWSHPHGKIRHITATSVPTNTKRATQIFTKCLVCGGQVYLHDVNPPLCGMCRLL